MLPIASLALMGLALVSCAAPPEQFQMDAQALELVADRIDARGYEMTVFRKGTIKPGMRLHLYLDGDGRPWLTRTQVAADPTPRNALVLKLLARGPSPALYLGRPCYHGEQNASGCSPWLWTAGRYSEPVVTAMATALEELIAAESISRVTLVGYSGGGVIAWHLAQRVPEVDQLVTIAANLDLREWTLRHSYSPLIGSLNPADGPPMRTSVQQLHLVGRQDRNTPAALTTSMQARFGPRFRRQLVDASHAEGWVEQWPGLLNAVR
jgi:pimeloyl-ACP methyl ester carboxylesterase